MAAGGWSLSHMWLTDGILSKNWPLVQELLELLLCCPVDVTRLKSNSSPKLVKGLSKDGGHEGKNSKFIFFQKLLFKKKFNYLKNDKYLNFANTQ